MFYLDCYGLRVGHNKFGARPTFFLSSIMGFTASTIIIAEHPPQWYYPLAKLKG